MAGFSDRHRQKALCLKREKRRIKRKRKRRDAEKKMFIWMSVIISLRHMMAFGRK